MSEYASSNSNYNWGYDPQSYFAFTGMYSTDPTDPMKRIEEFKTWSMKFTNKAWV